MEALQHLKEKYDKLGVEYKSEINNGKETLVIYGFSEGLTQHPDGKCEAIMKVTSKS